MWDWWVGSRCLQVGLASVQHSHNPEKFPTTTIVLGFNTHGPYLKQTLSQDTWFTGKDPRDQLRDRCWRDPFLLQGKGHQPLCPVAYLSLRLPEGRNSHPGGGTSLALPPRSSRTPGFAPFLPLRQAEPRTHRQQDPRSQLRLRGPDDPPHRQRARGRLQTAATGVRPVTSGSCHTAETVRTGAAPLAATRPGASSKGHSPAPPHTSPRSPWPPSHRGSRSPQPLPGQVAPHGLPEEAAPAMWRPGAATHRPPPNPPGGAPSPQPERRTALTRQPTAR